MFVDATRVEHAVCVLLGGTGHHEERRPQGRRVPVLLLPWSDALAQAAEALPAEMEAVRG